MICSSWITIVVDPAERLRSVSSEAAHFVGCTQRKPAKSCTKSSHLSAKYNFKIGNVKCTDLDHCDTFDRLPEIPVDAKFLAFPYSKDRYALWFTTLNAFIAFNQILQI